jgi:tRNA pseudouridine55 synthase
MRDLRADERRGIDGVLLLDKPSGLSSNQALQRVRRLFAAGKAGHTGSLDPLATGLLPICFGEATKIAGYLLGARKAYLAEVRLGVVTTTDDAEGEVLRRCPLPALADAAIEAALRPLRGCIRQIPPVYSALKKDGVPLYRRARRGEVVAAPPREVEVYRLDLVERMGDRLRLYVECAAGTYVRSLARDLGEGLGCGAHLVGLRRLWVEPFVQPGMHTLAELERAAMEEGAAGLARRLLPLSAALSGIPALQLDAAAARRLGYGQRLRLAASAGALYRALAPDGRLVALVTVDSAGWVMVRRGFAGATQEVDDARAEWSKITG